MLNQTYNVSTYNNTSLKVGNDEIPFYSYIILAFDFISLLIRLLLCIGMVKCQRKCHPFDVSCIIVANASFDLAIFSWIVESFIDSFDQIKLGNGFGFVCYIINSRQIFWILSNQSLVFLSFNRVYIIHQSLFNSKYIIPKSTQTNAFERWKFPVAFHSLHFTLILFVHLFGYWTNSVRFKDWTKCSKSSTGSAYKTLIYILRTLLPCLLMVINYVIIIPGYMTWHLRQSRMKKYSTNEINKKKVNKVIKLSFKHFIYTFFQTSSWLILAAVTEFILNRITGPPAPRNIVTMFETYFSALLDKQALVGVWWLEVIAWICMTLDCFNPLILIFLHKHLLNAIKGFLTPLKNIFSLPKSRSINVISSSNHTVTPYS